MERMGLWWVLVASLGLTLVHRVLTVGCHPSDRCT